MPYLNNILHPDRNTEEKVNFFCDYFSLVNKNLGESLRFRFDTPYSILNKIAYQLNHNLKEKSPMYIYNHLQSLNELDFQLVEGVVKNRAKLAELKRIKSLEVKSLTSEINKKHDYYKKLFSFFLEKLEEKEQEVAIDAIIGLLRCKHKLVTHRRLLIYFSKLLVSIFRFKGFSGRETEASLRSIFSKDIDYFPFPKDINDIEEDDKRKKKKKEYLDKRTFNEQFKAIGDAIDAERYRVIMLVRVFNVSTTNDVILEVEYDGVVFYSINHSKIKQIRVLAEKKQLTEDFFATQDPFIIAAIEVATFNLRDDSEVPKKKLTNAVQYLGYKLRTTFLTWDGTFILTTIDYSQVNGGRFFGPRRKEISNEDIPFINDNAFYYLSDSANILKNKVLYFESLYNNAKISNDISLMWQYLENLVPLGQLDKKQVKDIVAAIVCRGYHENIDSSYKEVFINAISYFSPGNLRFLPESELEKYRQRKYEDIDIYLATRNTDHAYMSLIGLHYKEDKSLKAIKKYHNYLKSVLTEAFEYRNMYIHRGYYNEHLLHKLSRVLPEIVITFRREILHIIIENPNSKSFDKLLIREAKRIIKRLDMVK